MRSAFEAGSREPTESRAAISSGLHRTRRGAVKGRKKQATINDVNTRYKVVLIPSDEGFSVSCPGLPGCWSQGATEPEALENIQDAIREYLAVVADMTRNSLVREVEVSV